MWRTSTPCPPARCARAAGLCHQIWATARSHGCRKLPAAVGRRRPRGATASPPPSLHPCTLHLLTNPPHSPPLLQMEYKKQLAANLGQDSSARILAFKQKAPAPAEGFENHLASLYTANNGPRPKKTFRAVPQQPERILDAPDLVDDYYLNLLDWGSTNSVRWWGGAGWLAGCRWLACWVGNVTAMCSHAHQAHRAAACLHPASVASSHHRSPPPLPIPALPPHRSPWL